jgi:hypothetical protein
MARTLSGVGRAGKAILQGAAAIRGGNRIPSLRVFRRRRQILISGGVEATLPA